MGNWVSNNVLNSKDAPAIYEDILANIPNYNLEGMLFVSKDTKALYCNINGSWDLIGGPGTGTITGSGTPDYIPVFVGASTIGNGLLKQIGTGKVSLDGSTNLSEYSFQVGDNRTTNGFAYLDLIGDAVYTDYGLRLLRGNTGQNTFSTIVHRGTGLFSIETNEDAAIQFGNSSSPSLQLTNFSSGGNAIIKGSTTSTAFIIPAGTSSQFLKADGSLDNNTYLTSTTAGAIFVPYTGAIANLNLGSNKLIINQSDDTINNFQLTGTFKQIGNSGNFVTFSRNGGGDYLSLYDTSSTLNNYLYQTFSTDTTGVGAANQVTFGRIGVQLITKDNATYKSDFRLQISNNGTLTEQFRVFSAGDVYIPNGSLVIGGSVAAGFNVVVSKNISGAVSSFGIYQNGTVQSGVTTQAHGNYNVLNTQAASFTLGTYSGFTSTQSSIGAGSTINNIYGFYATSSLTGGANLVAGFFSNVASGSRNWNFYANGTAKNYFAGTLLIGTTTDDTINKVQIVGTAISTGWKNATGNNLFNSTSGTTSIGTASNTYKLNVLGTIYDSETTTTLNQSTIAILGGLNFNVTGTETNQYANAATYGVLFIIILLELSLLLVMVYGVVS